MIEAISTPDIPGGIGPNSQGIKAGGFLFLSGQTPVNPETKELNGDSIEPQAEQIMQNIRAILSHQGLEFTDVVKTTCFLSDMKDYAGFNAVYAKYFVGKPARSCFAVKELPRGSLCEVELIALLK